MPRPALSASFVLFLACATASAADRPPNVLFIAVDDMNVDLGCYGHDLVKSPHIDRLAERGVRFDLAYCQQALCSPSRTSVMTGMRPDTTGVHDLYTHFRGRFPDAVTLSQLFRRNGYFAARIGKIYHYGNPSEIGTNGNMDDEKSWDVRINPAGRDKAEERSITNVTRRGLGSSLSFMAADGTDLEQTDGLVATGAIKLMEDHADRPFFIAAGFYRPHCPYVSPKRYFDLYPLSSITIPAIDRGDAIPPGVPRLEVFADYAYPYLGATRADAIRAKQAYYATISFVDAQVGRLLDAVDRLGLAENTLVVFWSDHGYHVGEKGLWMKRSNYDRALRVPLVLAGAGVETEAAVCGRPVELLDLYPTIAEICGLAPPAEIEGDSLVPLLDDPDAAWDDPAFSQTHRVIRTGPKNRKTREERRGYTLRTERFRYIEWDGGDGPRLLFDHQTDPDEERNLVDDPAYASVLEDLATRLRERVGG